MIEDIRKHVVRTVLSWNIDVVLSGISSQSTFVSAEFNVNDISIGGPARKLNRLPPTSATCEGKGLLLYLIHMTYSNRQTPRQPGLYTESENLLVFIFDYMIFTQTRDVM